MASGICFGVFGAGAIGAYVGARLHAAGASVVLLGRSSLRDELAAHGARLTDYRNAPPVTVRGLVVAENVDALAPCDVVLVTVKSGDTEAAARALAPVLRKDAVVVSLQNGVKNPEVLRAGLPGTSVLAGMVPFNVIRLPGGGFHQGTSGTIAIEASPRAEAVVTALKRAGLPARARPDIEQIVWGKLLINLNNAVNALSGVPIQAMIREPGYRRVMSAVVREGVAALDGARIRPKLETPIPARLLPRLLLLPDVLFRTALPFLQKVDAEARSSMSDDLARGRKTEVDVLNGEVVRLAARVGTPAPVNARIVALVHEAEAGAGAALSPEAMRSALAL